MLEGLDFYQFTESTVFDSGAGLSLIFKIFVSYALSPEFVPI
jgi:hypothetical protein